MRISILVNKIFTREKNHQTEEWDEVVRWVDEIATKVLAWLNWMTYRDLPYPPQIMQECNIEVPGNRWLQEYLEYLAEIFTREVIINKWLERKLIAWGKFDSTLEAPSILISIAFLDIYALQIIWIHHWISEQKLKWIVYRNMVFWNSVSVKSLAYLIKENTHPINWEIEWGIENLLAKIRKHTWKGTIENPACPFSKSDIRHEWMDVVFEFIKEKVIPIMQEHYWNSFFEWERFWCWVKDKKNNNSW